MKLSLTIWQKLFLAAFLFLVAIGGFMIKLPAVFRHNDKEMHTLFYFLAAAFLNILFAKRNFFIHAGIFAFLYLFSLAIEHAQEYSNQFFRKRIHGRYDPEDVEANVKGLVYFSLAWIIYAGAYTFFKKPPANSISNTPTA